MAKLILIDEIHITVLVTSKTANTPPIVRTLNSNRFQSRLRGAIADVLRQFEPLKKVEFKLSR